MENCKLQQKFECCFQDWINQQNQDLEELLQALSLNKDDDDENFQQLAAKGIKHFEDYTDKRALLAKHDAPSLLCPPWCTCFENAFLWIGGCRPSLSIRLVYSLCGAELNIDTGTADHLSAASSSPLIESQGNLADISSNQLHLINSLHLKTIKAEGKLSDRMASLQEEIADDPLAMIAKRARQVGESSQSVDEVLQGHSVALGCILVDADKLRLSTVKELFSILTPLQNADLLAASKKLHLSMREWGKRREQQMRDQCEMITGDQEEEINK
ncbi:OLC1v1023259C1 [Oldenlandia corymbosa var. corymbosa]|uniref:OLC1v1023259C1 n=1 Tax=Oldenlandia corymbosa var. corymbosa TaxID=529605 RepID=A0AAV1C0F8_OLDCO|nr:OLC1v1023259C1 [Oldenlandia corymbosa var. corymbosa]